MALSNKRATRIVKFKNKSLPATASVTYHQGALICWDTSTGLVCQGKASATLIPIGVAAESKTLGSGGGSILVELFREVVAMWFANSTSTDEVVAASLGGLAYVVDDFTVADNDNSNARSVLGRVWELDAGKGVLVEPLHTAGDATVSGLD